MRSSRPFSLFFLLSLVAALVLSYLVFMVDKAALHLSLCQPHSPFFDTFFRFYTKVGEAVLYVVALCLLTYRFGWTATLITSTALSGLLTSAVKHIVQAPRPLTFFSAHYPDITLPLVEGVKMNTALSFPSGHTTSFFAFFFTLSLLFLYDKYRPTCATSPQETATSSSHSTRTPSSSSSITPSSSHPHPLSSSQPSTTANTNNTSPSPSQSQSQTPSQSQSQNPSLSPSHTPSPSLSPFKSSLFVRLLEILFFSLALLGGYSRIYLSQHFAADVLGGLFIGVSVSALVVAVLLPQRTKKWWNKHFFAFFS